MKIPSFKFLIYIIKVNYKPNLKSIDTKINSGMVSDVIKSIIRFVFIGTAPTNKDCADWSRAWFFKILWPAGKGLYSI
jgi:hypothetical protein